MAKNPVFIVLGGVFALFIAMSIGRFAYTPILPFMQADQQFSPSFAGLLASGNYAGYLAGAIMASIVPLHRNRARYLRISLITSIVTTFIMGISHAETVWMIVRFISGMASAFVFVLVSSLILDQLAKRHKAHWIGYMYGGVGLGIFVSGLVVPHFIEAFHYEGAWIGLSIVALALGIFVWLNVREDEVEAAGDKQLVTAEPKKVPKWLPLLMIPYGLEGLGYIVTGTFIVAIAQDTPAFADNPTSVWMMVGLAAVPSTILWASIGSRFGLLRSLMAAYVIQAIGILLPVLSHSTVSFYIGALLFGGTFMGITTLTTGLVRTFMSGNTARVLAILTTVYALGQMIGPTLAGFLAAETGTYTYALTVAAIIIFIGAGFFLPLRKFSKE